MYENGGIRFSQVPFENCHTIAMAVGSEGGFDPEEAEQLQNAGAVSVWLGERILRCETAPSLPSPSPCTAPEICKSFQKQFKKVDRIINIVAKKDLYFFRKHGILITEPEHRPVHIKDQALENGITGGADRGQQALHSYISTLADFYGSQNKCRSAVFQARQNETETVLEKRGIVMKATTIAAMVLAAAAASAATIVALKKAQRRNRTQDWSPWKAEMSPSVRGILSRLRTTTATAAAKRLIPTLRSRRNPTRKRAHRKPADARRILLVRRRCRCR